jgi:hypothetical protein
LYLGAENDQVNRYRYRVSDELPGEDNKMDLFVGGNAGVLWGVSFGMSMTEDEINNNSSSTSLVSRFGIKTQRYDLYGMIEISNNAESKVNNTKIEYEGDLGFQLGYIQKYAEYSIFGNIKHLDFQFKNGTDVTDVDSTYDFIDNGKFNQDELQIGFGKAKIVNEKAKIFTRLTVDYLKSKKDLDSGTDISITEYSIPVSFAIEYEASNWLVFRGSISQSLFSKYKQGSLEYTKRNSTNVNAGLSFIWGTFQLDGLIGTSSNGSTVDTENETGTLATDQLMSKASIKYRF